MSAGSLRVLRVADVDATTPGGMSVALTEGARALRSLGAEVDLLFGDGLARWPLGRVRRLVTPWCVVAVVAARRRRGRAYDVVELHEPLSGPYALLRAPLRLPPLVVFSHGLEELAWAAQRDRVRRRGGRERVLSRVSVPLTRLLPNRYGLRRASHVTVLNERDRSWLVEVLGVPARQVSVVSNGVTADFVRARRDDAGGPPRLAFLGSWLDRKGVPELVEGIERLAARGLAFDVRLLGTRVGAEEVAAAFSDTVRDRVEVVPDVARGTLPGLLAGCDVLVAPAWFEGMPLGVLEAAATGMAVVASDIPGHREVFPCGESDGALLVAPHDASALATALWRLLEDEGRLVAAQRAAHATARRFTWARAAAGHLSAYRTACGQA